MSTADDDREPSRVSATAHRAARYILLCLGAHPAYLARRGLSADSNPSSPNALPAASPLLATVSRGGDDDHATGLHAAMQRCELVWLAMGPHDRSLAILSCWAGVAFSASMAVLIGRLLGGNSWGVGGEDSVNGWIWLNLVLLLSPCCFLLLGPISAALQIRFLRGGEQLRNLHFEYQSAILRSGTAFHFHERRFQCSLIMGLASFLLPSPFHAFHQHWNLVLGAAICSGDVESLAAFSHLVIAILACCVGLIWHCFNMLATGRGDQTWLGWATIVTFIFNVGLIGIRQLLQFSATVARADHLRGKRWPFCLCCRCVQHHPVLLLIIPPALYR